MSHILSALHELATPEVIVGTGGVGSSLWLLWKKFLVSNSKETKNLAASDAEVDVINLLRSEVKRLSEINVELANALNELQLENINLKREISNMHTTLNDMKDRMGMATTTAQEPINLKESMT
jgi:FtsZ-binding cell division protein ZapB